MTAKCSFLRELKTKNRQNIWELLLNQDYSFKYNKEIKNIIFSLKFYFDKSLAQHRHWNISFLSDKIQFLPFWSSHFQTPYPSSSVLCLLFPAPFPVCPLHATIQTTSLITVLQLWILFHSSFSGIWLISRFPLVRFSVAFIL